MFPSIVIDLSGLEPDSKYTISLEINPADTHRYKFVNSRWVFAGKGESHDETMLVFHHPESPSTGKHWMKNKVSFKKIKLSNNRNNKRGQVVALNSMHKYLPRVVISKVISKKKSAVVHSEDLEKCIFVAVTAYQNDQVTQLKIDYNPFAKAFRDTGADQHYSDYGSTVGTSNVGMMSAWPPLSPLLSPYGDTQALMSPASLQPSPLPQFNAAFGNFETSPPYSPLPTYRQMSASNPVFQQQSVFGLPGQQPRPSPIPRFNSVFNNWETHPNPSSPLTQNVGSAFLIPPSQQPPTTLA
uniref:TbxA2 n=1 Tax=Halichondria bowerbanki TaxID=145470 RepID=E7CWN6_HALBO|nr:TbxA2 [Halichondria bowerbanki]